MGQKKYKKNSNKGNVRNAIILIAILTIVGMLAARFVYGVPLNNPPIRSDGQGYYMYLPAFFIYHDPEMHFIDQFGTAIQAKEGSYFQASTGSYVDKYTMGTALMELPFFLLAHLLTLIINPEAANGLSSLYQWFNIISAGVWFAVGSFFSYLIASRYAEKKSVLWALGLCTFGSNLFHYICYDACFSHVYSYAAIAIFIWYIIRIEEHEAKGWEYLILGILYGLIILVRLTDATVIILYGFFGITSWKGFVERMKKIFHPKRLFLPIAGAFIVFLPQMLYWYRTAGVFFMNSYGETDAGFIYWYCPKFLNVLFTLNKGVYFWCPLLLLCTVFFVIESKKVKELLFPCAIFYIIYLYVIASWWGYDFGGGFGHRIFVNIMPLFIIGGSLMLDKLRTVKAAIRYSVYGLSALAICWTMILMFAYWYYVIPFGNYTFSDIANAFKWFFG